MNTKINIVAASLFAAMSTPVYSDSDMEKITITNQTLSTTSPTVVASGNQISPDAASWLEIVPGAGINRNGGTTGIAQYRGLYGDRVSVKMNHHHLIGSGPNAMDPPLSYAMPLMIDSMTVYRGISPVYAGMDTIGGAIDVKLKQAELAGSNLIAIDGNVMAAFQQQGNAKTFAGMMNIANNKHGVLVYANNQDADNMEDGENRELPSSFYNKKQYGIDYKTQLSNGLVGFSYHKTDTQDSGTAALPMDIGTIDADRIDISGQQLVADWQIDWSFGYLDSNHTMDNHRLRVNMMPSMYRLNTADAVSSDFKFQAMTSTPLGTLTIGADGYLAKHNSTITSLENPMFNIKNFSNAKDDRIGFYGHLDTQFTNSSLALGLRIKHNSSDAGEVSHHMAMMNESIMMLQNAFNKAKKKQSDINVDLMANWTTPVSDNSQLILGAAIKQRAPSYQERYLWVPMQSTGGLADGHTYIGNIELDSETAYQLNAGFSVQDHNFGISPNFFYQEIKDYIQGVPSANVAANMVASMMSGPTPLQFDNVDAALYGVDMTMRYRFSDKLIVTGVTSYVRGKRKDINDNLYRITAPNIKLKATYHTDNWQANLGWQLFAKQDKVSIRNTEVASAGYALVNVSGIYYFDKFSVEVGVNNLLDKLYHDHVAGTNRVMMADIPKGEKLSGTGRDAYLKVSYQF